MLIPKENKQKRCFKKVSTIIALEKKRRKDNRSFMELTKTNFFGSDLFLFMINVLSLWNNLRWPFVCTINTTSNNSCVRGQSLTPSLAFLWSGILKVVNSCTPPNTKRYQPLNFYLFLKYLDFKVFAGHSFQRLRLV